MHSSKGLFALLLFAAVFSAPSVAVGSVTEAQARATIEKEFGVRVLKIVPGTLHERSVYFLTIMSQGGNDNGAFQVNRLALDRETGQLVSGFRHRASGHDDAGGAGGRETNRQPTDVLRQGWDWR